MGELTGREGAEGVDLRWGGGGGEEDSVEGGVDPRVDGEDGGVEEGFEGVEKGVRGVGVRVVGDARRAFRGVWVSRDGVAPDREVVGWRGGGRRGPTVASGTAAGAGVRTPRSGPRTGPDGSCGFLDDCDEQRIGV